MYCTLSVTFVAVGGALPVSRLKPVDGVETACRADAGGLALALQRARLGRKLTQAQLALSMHVCARDVREWESGVRVPSAPVVRRLEDVLRTEFTQGQARALV